MLLRFAFFIWGTLFGMALVRILSDHEAIWLNAHPFMGAWLVIFTLLTLVIYVGGTIAKVILAGIESITNKEKN